MIFRDLAPLFWSIRVIFCLVVSHFRISETWTLNCSCGTDTLESVERAAGISDLIRACNPK